MKIVFLCGCVEPGKDGVGDYTLRLSAELIRIGNDVRIVTLNDPFVVTPGPSVLYIEGLSISVYRAPSIKWISNNPGQINAWLQAFSTDVFSLQYVPFAFHPKGLPFGISRIIKLITGGSPIHIMFHELWVGMNQLVNPKEKYWGVVQKRLIKSMVSGLKPVSVHTQTHLYQLQLAGIGVRAALLPLFGNICVDKPAIQGHLSTGTNNEIKLVIFGAIHPGSPFINFAHDAFNYSKQENISLSLTFVGRCGEQLQRFAGIWQQLGMPVSILGEQSPDIISSTLSMASIGLTTTPLMLVEKSGTVAAMLEHGLPVICLPKPWTTTLSSTPHLPEGVIAYTNTNIVECLSTPSHLSVTSLNNVSRIASLFLSELPLQIYKSA